MRSVPLALIAPALVACALVARSPALKSPLKDRLAKAGTTTIEDAAKACLAQTGWAPDDIGAFAEGATVVSAKNPTTKERVSVYIQPPEMSPRVTGGPEYDNPFWPCLSRELGGGPKPAAPASSGETGEGAEK